MSVTQVKWLPRFGLPVAGFIIALFCGRTVGGAIGMVLLTALFIVLVVAMPFSFIGIIFVGILGLYGLKYSSRKEPEMDFRDPIRSYFFFLGFRRHWRPLDCLHSISGRDSDDAQDAEQTGCTEPGGSASVSSRSPLAP